MRSVSPRGSEWVMSVGRTHVCAQGGHTGPPVHNDAWLSVPTHPPPRGGTDLITTSLRLEAAANLRPLLQ
jgi:hypothetical protein